MSGKKLLLGAAGILGLFSAVGLLATNFDIYEITSGTYANAVWPGTGPTITWNLNFASTSSVPANVDENGSGVTPFTALTNAFGTWQNARYNGSSVTNVGFKFGTASTTFNASPHIDCQNVISFSDPDSSDFATGVIAVTVYSTITNGEVPSQCTSPNQPPACPLDICIIDADVVFNPQAIFATAAATSGQFDLQSVATHEIGHIVGLDHSGIANAIMFPYGDTSNIGVHQALWTDDLIGVSHLYPGATTPNAGIEGTVTLQPKNSNVIAPTYAAHVVAIDSTTGNAITDTLTDPLGNYHLLTFGGTFYVYVQSLGQNSSWGPCTIQNFRGQAGYDPSGNNNIANIPTNPTDYTGTYY